MRIGVRLTVSLVVPLVALTVLVGVLYQRRSQELLREELGKEGRAVALVVQIASEDYLRDLQFTDLKQLIDRATGYEHVLGFRLFDASGKIIYQSTSLEPYPFRHQTELHQVLAQRKLIEMRRFIGKESVVGFIEPLVDRSARLQGAVQVLQLESYIHEDSMSTLKFILSLIVVMAIAIIAVVMVVTRVSITRPVAELVTSFREIGAQGVAARVPVHGDDEFGWLAREFNGMCERLQAARLSLATEQERRRQIETRLRNAERLAGLGRLAAGLAHEIGTPLNVISGRAESLIRTVDGNDIAQKHLRIITAQTERIVRIVRDMLDFARQKPPRRVATDLAGAVRDVLDLVEAQLAKRSVRVETVFPDELPTIVADPDQLQQVFLNLTLNAMDAMPQGGTLRISLAPEVLTDPARGGLPKSCVTVCFADTGTGIAPEVRNHVFDPFFTTKEAGQGTGLGLSVSYGIIEEHSGWFELTSDIDAGTRITVVLPLNYDREEASA